MGKEEAKNVKVLPGGITEQQLNMWKGRFKKVLSITVNDGDESYTGYFKRPDNATMSLVAKLAKSDEVKASVALLDNCWLGGDEGALEDAVIKMAMIGKLQSIMQVTSSEIKNW